MFINIILSLIFAASLYILWYRVAEIIPNLASIPDDTINALLKEESAKIRVFLLEIKSWLKEEKHKDHLKKFLHKTLQKIHVLILRLDNKIISVLKKIKTEQDVATPKPVEEIEIIKPSEVEAIREIEIAVQTPQSVLEIKKVPIIEIFSKRDERLGNVETKKRRGRPPGSGKKK